MLIILSCSFFLDAHRITSKEYIPSNSDILRAPARVQMGQMGAMEAHLPMGQLLIRLYHVVKLGSGGRMKWIHFLDNMTSILFCTSLSDYGRCDEHGVGRICFPFALMYLMANCSGY